MKQPFQRQPDREEKIDATAAAWIALCDDGASAEQRAEFARWRAEDSRHEAAAARLESTQLILRQLRGYRPEALRHPDSELLRRRSPHRTPWLRLSGALAAIAILVGAFAVFKRTDAPDPHSATRFATEQGGYICQTLEDGSLLELNAASEVRVRYTPEERRLILVRGEAHFKVAKNPRRPFLVETNCVVVKAVGTAFNIRIGASDVEVLVTEGRVAVAQTNAAFVTKPDRPAASASAPSAGETTAPSAAVVSTEIQANERVVFSNASSSERLPAAKPRLVEKVSTETIHKALSWLGPKLLFDQTPLREAVRQLNQRSFTQIELAEEALGDTPISGSFRSENVDAFVRLLTSGADIVADRDTPGRIVLRQAK